MQRQCKASREEERDGDHMRGIVMEVAVLIAGVRDPIEVGNDSVREAVTPGSHQHGPDHHQRKISEDGEAKCERHVIADAYLPAEINLAKCPGSEGAQRADGDDLPDAAFLQRRKGQSVFSVWRIDADLPEIPGRAECRVPKDHRDPDQREEHRRHTEEADVERTNPEVEQVTADERSAANAIFSFKAEHCHRSVLRVRKSSSLVSSSVLSSSVRWLPEADEPGRSIRPRPFRYADRHAIRTACLVVCTAGKSPPSLSCGDLPAS